MIYTFLEHYFNYYILFGWSILEGEVGLVLAGAFTQEGKFIYEYVLLTAISGAYLGDTFVFFLGRHYKLKAEQWLQHHEKKVKKTEDIFSRYGSWILFFERYIYGAHIPSLLIIGASEYSVVKFLIIDLLAVSLWATTFTALGYFFGSEVIQLLNLVSRYLSVIIILLVLMLFLKSVNVERKE